MEDMEIESELIKLISNKITNNELEEALQLVCDNEDKLCVFAEFWNLKALICIKASEYDAAKNCLEKALSKDENNIDYLFNLAYVYEKLNNKFKAYYTYEKLEELCDNSEEKKELIKRMDEICFKNQQIIEKNTDNNVGAEFGDNIYTARKNVVQAMEDDNIPLVDVCIQAYNNLEKYTKTCVECVLKYTKNINYRLILIDNGSNDGTFEYFKSIKHPNKKIVRVTKNLGSAYGANQIYLNYNASYMVYVPNDLFVTENWLSNMLTCAMSDEKIGMVVPACDNVPNQQSINLDYKDFDDMQRKACKYNKSDSRMWEERIRLVTLGTLFKKECLDVIGFFDYGFFHEFSDDDITFRVRRAGYKAVLCKDTFVSHAGTGNDRGAELSKMTFEAGRKIFNEKYNGIDSWEDGDRDPAIVSITSSENKSSLDGMKILGIDTGCGQKILDVKNKLRNNGIFNTYLSAFSTEARFFSDLNTVCKEVNVDKIDTICSYYDSCYFDYIVIGKYINEYENPYRVVKNATRLLKSTGQLIIKIGNTDDFITLLKILGFNFNVESSKARRLNYDDLNEYLKQNNCIIDNIIGVNYDFIDSISGKIDDIVKFLDDNARNKAFVKEYVVSIVKTN